MSRHRTPVFATAILSAALWASSCGDGNTEPPPDLPRPTTVTVTPATAELTALDATVQLNAQVLDQYGQVMAGAAVTWSSGDASVAAVDGAGLVTAAANGAATITATAGSASGTAAVTVAQVVSTVEVSPAAHTVVERDTVRFEAAALDANGHAVAAAEFAWSSSDTSVAVVDGAGLVSGVGAGEVEVTAVVAGVAGSASLVVEAPVPTTVTVAPDTLELTALADTVRLTAEVRDQIGRVMEDEVVAWLSGDTMVAVVDSVGLVGAVGNGVVTVTATAGSASGEAVVTVIQSAGSVVVSPAADTVALGDTLRLEAVAFDVNGHLVADAVFTWTSSDAPVAAVDGSGLVTAVAEGTATITARAGDARGTAEVAVQNPDRAALEALYHATDGPNWVNSENWLTDGPLRNWYGVHTDASGRVARLDLSGSFDYEAQRSVVHGLSGTIPPEIGNLAGLMTLNLGYNLLNGPIPPELGKLASLTGLILMHNQLTGSIPPELGDLASLQDLSLYNNDLTGPIPSTLGNLASLRRLSVFDNDLSGPIPPELGSLASLALLGLGRNRFTGAIPPELGDLASLQYLSLYDNDLTGPIPATLGNLASLVELSVSSNDLTGPLPPELGNLGNLARLYLHGNALTGPIPTELGSLANLTELYLGGNALTGPIPAELGSLANLVWLILRDNRLTGPIPPELGNLGNLEWLLLWRNQLTGPIPPSLSRLAALRYFSIGENALCAPGTSVFAAWLQTLESHDAAGTGCNAADVEALKSLYEAAGGTGWTESGGWPDGGFVEDWHGVTADSLGRVTELDLAGNGLEGRLPSDLGALTRMTVLRVGDNALKSRLPLSLGRVPLREFHYANTELCAPAEASFQAWLDGIQSHVGTGIQCVPLSDRDILALLYEATGGPDWVRNRNWLTEAPLRQWDGVFVDDEGHVVRLFSENNNLAGSVPVELGSLVNLTELNLGANQLTGPIPAELGSLANLTGLSLGRNQLSGPIPAELGNLASLTRLDLDNNQLTGPIPADLGSLANVVGLFLGGNALTGPIPPELGNLGNLTTLALGGNALAGEIPPELGNLSSLTRLNLTRNSVTGTIPPELGNLGNLTALALGGNALAGEIPPELGSLTGLKELNLWGNGLTGEIPPELGNLSELVVLSLSTNQLTGPIPPELGNLARVTQFRLQGNALSGAIPGQLGRLASVDGMLLWGNDLTGPIPPELGNLSSVRILSVSDNNLSGPIPPELGNLGSLTYLSLANNALSGSLPPELGSLATLERLFLEYNDLEGPVPHGLGGMAGLKELGLTGNEGMEGALPADMTDLRQLDALLAGNTGLCAPTDLAFQTWLDRVFKRRIAPCLAGNPPAAYLVQAVQSRTFPVPLVAGKRALLRVFPTARHATEVGIPAVRARFYLNGRETHVENIPGKSSPIPTEVDESSLSKSANAAIPAWVVQPGLELIIEVDPEGTLDEALGVARRIPETGRMTVDVRSMPPFDLTLIPFIWSETLDSSIVDLVEAMAADPGSHEMLSETRSLLPTGDLVVTAHEPVVSSSNSAFSLLSQTVAIRAMEGGMGYYKGMMSPPVTGAGGVARRPGRSSFSQPYPAVLAHELGHNLSLRHAPCGGAAGPDPSYPYTDGSIGAWGYDFRDGGSLVRPSTPDLMSYCGPKWISDFYFTNALRFRLSDADSVGLPYRAPPTRSLLLWGGVGADSVPFLEPAFVVEARPELPQAGGEYRLTGRTGGGDDLFSFSFAMPVVADGDGSSSFAFVLPVESGWDSALATITLSGPGGSTTLDADTDLEMTILRNPRNGQVRGILRDVTGPGAAAAFRAAPGLEVLFSRGIPDAAAWRR